MKVSLLEIQKHPSVVNTSLGACGTGGLTVDSCSHTDLAEGGVMFDS